MPAALDVDREQVRMLVLSIGVREAARQMGLNEDTVATWSANGGWLAHLRPVFANSPRPASMIPRSSTTSKPADALQNVLEENFGKSRIGLSKWLRTSAEKLGAMDGDAALEFHGPAVSAATVLSKLCPPQAAVSMRISMFGSPVDALEALPEAQVTIDLPEDDSDPMDAF